MLSFRTESNVYLSGAECKGTLMSIIWILEREVFSDGHKRLADAAVSAGHRVISWEDRWWNDGKWPSLKDEYVIFHGSLGNAKR